MALPACREWEVTMNELWFWLVSVFSVSPAGIRETSVIGRSFSSMGISYE